MSGVGWLPGEAQELFGTDATAEESYDLLTVDVPPAAWIPALETARDRLGCTYFDWLSAVDEPGTGFRVAAHVVALGPVRRLLLRTTVPHEAPVLPTAVAVYAGAAWHERETHEMFGVTFTGHPGLDHLLLPEGFEGHPLRKDFVLAARVAKAWPGAKEPGESEHGGPRRRQMLPPGVPDPNEWGPLKGQLPPAPTRPARGTGAGTGRAAGERPTRAAGERPPRRTRTASEGSASQTAPASGEAAPTPATPRRSRSASQGSASQRQEAAPDPSTGETTEPVSDSQAATTPPSSRTPRRARSASQGSASQRQEAAPDPNTGEATEPAPEKPAPPRGSDAPWHHARPAFDEPEHPDEPEQREQPEQSKHPELSEQPEHPELSEEPQSEPGPEPDADAPATPPEPPTPPNSPPDSPGGPQ